MRVVSAFMILGLAATLANAQQPLRLEPIELRFLEQSDIGGMHILDAAHSLAELKSESLFYFDIANPVSVNQFPMSIGGGNIIVLISQRFTSPSVETYLDSVRFYSPTVTSGDIKLHILRDTLLEVSTGSYLHFPNVSGSEFASIDTTRILREDIPPGGVNMRSPFPGRMLPDEWHVVFEPVDRGDFQPAFTLAFSMDSVSRTSLTPENLRVTFYYAGTSRGLGAYTVNTPNPDYVYLPNIVMSASVHYETGTSIATIPDDGGVSIAGVYPHPISQSHQGGATIALNVGAEQQIEIAVYDVMGRKVRSVIQSDFQYGNQLVSLPTSGLAPGTYLVRANGERMSATKTLVVTP